MSRHVVEFKSTCRVDELNQKSDSTWLSWIDSSQLNSTLKLNLSWVEQFEFNDRSTKALISYSFYNWNTLADNVQTSDSVFLFDHWFANKMQCLTFASFQDVNIKWFKKNW